MLLNSKRLFLHFLRTKYHRNTVSNMNENNVKKANISVTFCDSAHMSLDAG